jgi:hypothetical protein
MHGRSTPRGETLADSSKVFQPNFRGTKEPIFHAADRNAQLARARKTDLQPQTIADGTLKKSMNLRNRRAKFPRGVVLEL